MFSVQRMTMAKFVLSCLSARKWLCTFLSLFGQPSKSMFTDTFLRCGLRNVKCRVTQKFSITFSLCSVATIRGHNNINTKFNTELRQQGRQVFRMGIQMASWHRTKTQDEEKRTEPSERMVLEHHHYLMEEALSRVKDARLHAAGPNTL